MNFYWPKYHKESPAISKCKSSRRKNNVLRFITGFCSVVFKANSKVLVFWALPITLVLLEINLLNAINKKVTFVAEFVVLGEFYSPLSVAFRKNGEEMILKFVSNQKYDCSSAKVTAEATEFEPSKVSYKLVMRCPTNTVPNLISAQKLASSVLSGIGSQDQVTNTEITHVNLGTQNSSAKQVLIDVCLSLFFGLTVLLALPTFSLLKRDDN
jgi:hypothetical protein